MHSDTIPYNQKKIAYILSKVFATKFVYMLNLMFFNFNVRFISTLSLVN
jgi:hypothetical protein